MMRIDFYVQHLIKHDAKAIEIESGQPVRFVFEAGDRQSSKAIEHAQLSQLVQEAAPNKVLDELRQSGRAVFTHNSDAGMVVDVSLRTKRPGVWAMRIAPSSGASAAPSASPAPSSSFGAGRALGGGRSLGGSTGGAPAASAPSAAPVASAPPSAAPKSKGLVSVQRDPSEPEMNYYLRLMKANDASDLHLSPDCVPLARIDGSIKELEPGAPPLDPEHLERIIMEITPPENREEFADCNDTDYAHAIEGLCRFRANVFRDRKGVGAVFRQIPFELLTVEQIGLPKKVLDLCWLSKGLVLVTGPTGSGKSTTLSTLIDFINQNRDDHIITIEDPIEFVHPNKKCLINQREIGTHTKSFKSALRAALREDPDIVLVGEMRDLETIAIAIETAETGHLVFGTLHTTSAPSTVDRIIDQFPPEQQEQIRVMLSESLRGVVAQVLCKKVGGGRVAAYEILVGNPAIANLIREGKTYQLKSAMQTGKKLGMQTMNAHLLEHVQNGLVTPEEAYVKSNDKVLFKQQLQGAGIQLSLGGD